MYWKKIVNYLYGKIPLDPAIKKKSIDLGHTKISKGKIIPANIQKYKPINHRYRLGFYEFISNLKTHLKSHGFSEIEPKAILSSFDCFGRLLEDKTHPSRSKIDTFYLPLSFAVAKKDVKNSPINLRDLAITKKNNKFFAPAVLTTHTTARAFSYYAKKGTGAGRYFIVGRVFRNQREDKTHTIEFHQLEISCFSPQITLASLVEVFKLLFAFAGWPEKKLRFKQSFYNYTQPSLDAQVEVNGAWVEICGGGLFKRSLLDQIGLDKKINALGAGIGLERLYGLYSKIRDIRKILDYY